MTVRQRRRKQYRGVLVSVKYVSLVALVVLAALALLPAPAAEAMCANGLMYGVTRNDPDNPTDSAVYEVDKFGNMTIVATSIGFPSDAIARDPVNCDTLYLISNIYAPAGQHHVLYSFSVSSATATQVGSTGLTEKYNLDRLAFSPEGILYALHGTALYTIDTVSAAPSLLGTVSGWSALNGGDIAFTPDEVLWAVAGNQLFRINNYASNPAAVPACTGSLLPDEMQGLGANSDGLLQVFAWENGARTMELIDPDESQDPCRLNPPPFPVIHSNAHICDLTSAQDASPTAISLAQMEIGRGATNLALIAFLALAFVGLALLSHHQLRQTLPF